MRTRYTVWEWNQWTGWTLFLGSNVYSMADQVKRGMKFAEPQKFYGVYGPYEVNAVYEIVGTWQRRNYSWGWANNKDHAAEMVYALNMTLRPDVFVWAKETSTGRVSVEVDNTMPYWWKTAILDRRRAAGIAV